MALPAEATRRHMERNPGDWDHALREFQAGAILMGAFQRSPAIWEAGGQVER